MIILLDAYNILKRDQPTRDISEGQRRTFIDRVANYARLREHTVFIVFDGGTGRFPSKSYVNPVTVIYSGTEQSADDVLKRLCVEYAHKQTMLVSSDRQLCHCAQAQGVVCLDAEVWESVLTGARDVVQAALPVKPGEAHKRAGHESSAELDALMQRASEQMMVKDEEGGFAGRRAPAKQTLSKEEKKIQKLVKKL